MSNSSYRNKDFETVHHITSRIAHKVRFLQDEAERTDLVNIIRRAAEFTGIKLIGWCVMVNHFHILAFLPRSVELSDDEVVRRYGVLKGASAAAMLQTKLCALRDTGAEGENKASLCLDAIRKRMYKIGSFMKIVKQWFSEEYNRRTDHKGTLWEGPYYDRIVPYKQSEIRKCLGYVHLNPIRAAACATFDGYPWSSYCDFKRGDETAVAGMRFVYDVKNDDGSELSLSEIAELHEDFLGDLLESEKLRMAQDIARKRAAGQVAPIDPLTTEAMVAQVAEHMSKVYVASMELQEQRQRAKSVCEKHKATEQALVALVEVYPGIRTDQLMELLAVSKSTLYRILSSLKETGVLDQDGRGCGWRKSPLRKQV